MATTLGDNGVVQIGANVVAEVTAFSVTESADKIEDTALGDANKTFKAGKPEVSGSIDCWWDDSDTTGQGAMTVGSIVSLDLRPEGTGSGFATWTVSASIDSIETNVAFNEIVTAKFTWSAAGTLTKGTQP